MLNYNNTHKCCKDDDNGFIQDGNDDKIVMQDNSNQLITNRTTMMLSFISLFVNKCNLFLG